MLSIVTYFCDHLYITGRSNSWWSHADVRSHSCLVWTVVTKGIKSIVCVCVCVCCKFPIARWSLHHSKCVVICAISSNMIVMLHVLIAVDSYVIVLFLRWRTAPSFRNSWVRISCCWWCGWFTAGTSYNRPSYVYIAWHCTVVLIRLMLFNTFIMYSSRCLFVLCLLSLNVRQMIFGANIDLVVFFKL